MLINEANYQPHFDLNLNGNPLTEAIQVELDKEKFLRTVTITPDIQENFWELPPFYHKTQLLQLTDVHTPHPHIWNLYCKILSLILYSYVRRSPFSRDVMQQRVEIAEQMRKGEFPENTPIGPTTALTALIYGVSGTGKTSTIRTILKQINQVIHHTSYKAAPFKASQLTWVSFDLPPNGAPKAMAANFFRAVDAALGTEYAKEWERKNNVSVDRHLSGMQQVAYEHHLGLVHIDELQFMLKYAKHKDSPSLQIIESLFNKIGIPIIQSCTEDGLEIFQQLSSGDYRVGTDTTTLRRMLNDRSFKFSHHKLDSDYFDQLFNSLFPNALIYQNKQHNLKQFKSEFHRLSCGLPAMMVRLAGLHHEALLNTYSKPNTDKSIFHTFNVDILKTIYKNQFSLIDPALQEYRYGNQQGYEKGVRSNSPRANFTNEEVSAAQTKNHTPSPPLNKADPFNPQYPLSVAPPDVKISSGFGETVDE
jgi:hypothetical protein